MKNKKQNYFIEFLRFIFSLIIMFYHSWSFAPINGATLFRHGYLAVNFYFILTGYLMMNSLYKNKKSTFDFMKNKIQRLAPGIILSFFICYAFTFGSSGLNLATLFSNDVLADLLQLNVVGIGGVINSAWWYLSAMLFVLFLLYPLAKKYKDKYTKVIAPLLIILTLAIVDQYDISMTWHSKSSFIFTDGFYKAIIYIALGNISYEIAQYFKKFKLDKLKTILITISEILIYGILIFNMHIKYIDTMWFAVLFTIGVSITFSNLSLTSKVFNNNIWKKLGNFGFYLYLTHSAIRTYMKRRNSLVYYDMLPRYLVLSLAVALFVYVMIEYLYPMLKRKISKKYLTKS